ncbi:MAG: bifunctional 4-hydroxy-3-methylbut-2-enyl diphosphate reductase/30S ribosomal protein S1 [Oscillospiraceae bacterium]|nr:bifunctional 4-hydroxy-3-methylbut-2-enyl diphosphate reductase/30S ribosomal protein S1 [Oscillospiraceae bacterium]
MAKIKVAKTAGFCFGVDRAVKLVYSEIEKGNKNVATLGPIIHNADVVSDLKSKGVRIVDSVSELKNGETAVIRSHGVGREIYTQLEEKGNPYIDATCPFVARIHKIVREKTNEGYFILIAGDKNHPEVQGIVGHCDENCFVFKDEFDLKEFFSKKYKKTEKKLAIVAQTTYNILIWGECIKVVPHDDENILVFDTICNATSQRQSDAALLSKEVDAMVVVGGKNSSNTIKLYNVCCENCPSYHIENASELYRLDLNNADKIGITAGASTPAYIIKEVQNTMEEIFDFEKELEQSFKKVHTGERVKGYIAAVNNSEAIVDIGTKHTGYVPLAELTDDQTKKPADVVSVGDEVDLIVTKINDQEGIVMLSKKKVDELLGFDNITKAKEEETVLDGTVISVVKGGILVSVDGVRVFVPASQTGLGRDKSLDELLKKNVQLKVIEVNESRRRAVGSIKAVTKAQKEAAKAAFWESAEEGKTYKGEVKSLTSYGAFVDLGGIDGMVHISELSWSRIKHPNQVVKPGDILEVYIKELDKEAGRISLGYKKAEDNPWVKFEADYKVGDVVKATIVSITPFGAFAKIIEGVDGLIHISQIADKRVDNVNEVLSVGQEVDVKITEIDLDAKRISISIRALLENTADAEETDAE